MVYGRLGVYVVGVLRGSGQWNRQRREYQPKGIEEIGISCGLLSFVRVVCG